MRLDIDAVIARLDLTEIVKRQVDVNEVAALVDLDAAATRLDIDAVVDRIDLVGLAREVIAAIDLPEIIRESTGSMASETWRGVRMQGISGDDALARVVDRMRLHRGRRDATPKTV
jgi:2,4-dienoyl-CoA reductase-like NADH-dependent reductase (Old Yellow Enzyme family)